eukprot:1188458-Alexandrium_andersonii.AAC.1
MGCNRTPTLATRMWLPGSERNVVWTALGTNLKCRSLQNADWLANCVYPTARGTPHVLTEAHEVLQT